LEINGPTIRGIVSLVLPAGKGTTIVIGLSGKPATAAQGTARNVVDNSTAKINVVQFLSSCSFRILNVPFKFPEKALPLTFPYLLALRLAQFLSCYHRTPSSVFYGTVWLVVAARDITVSAPSRQTVGVIDANGAGRMAFINTFPTKGTIHFEDRAISRSFQVVQMLPSLTVFERICAACAVRLPCCP
jgi:hypothetical protein